MIYRQPGKIRVEIREVTRPRIEEYPETPYISVAGLFIIAGFYAFIVVLFRVWT
jgi:hypothetical protein